MPSLNNFQHSIERGKILGDRLIYKITNIINGKCYIGKSTESYFKKRIYRHRKETSLTDTHFGRAIQKYGWDNFVVDIIERNIHAENINDREVYWIKYYDSFKNGYNSTLGGEGGNTYSKKSKEELDVIKEKISKKNSGMNNGIAKNPHLVQGKNNGMYGKRPPNAKITSLVNVNTGEIVEFDRSILAAKFLGYKNGNIISRMRKQKDLIICGWKLL